MPAPVMWDARTDPETGDPTHVAAVEVASVARQAGGSELVLTPAAAFVADPGLQFPVTIDPSITATAVFDTYVQNTSSTSTHTATELRIGTTVAGTTTARSFLRFDMSPVYGKRIGSAQLNMWLLSSNSCNVATWELWRTGWADYATVWSNQPSWVTHYHTTSQGCGSGWTNIPATGWVQWAADNQYPYITMGLKGTLETTGQVSSWKRFSSIEAGSGVPYLSITYDTAPSVTAVSTTPATQCVIGSGRPFINTTTPTLAAQVSDPEASPVAATFEWWVTNGSLIGSTTSSAASSGSTFSATVPFGAFTNGNNYSWRVRGTDSYQSGPWSPWCEFTVDTTAPSALPGVSSATYPERPPTPDGYISAVESRPFEGGTSVVSGLTGDDAVTTVSLPFAFTFYGQPYASAWVDTNGQLYFVDPGGSHPDDCQPLPNTAAPNGGIYAFCDDLVVDTSAAVRTATVGSAPQRQFIVEWHNVHRYDNSAERLSVSLILSEDGEIAVNYTGIDPASSAERGGEALVGVENAGGTKAEQYSYHLPVLADGQAVVFRPGVLPPTSYTKSTPTLTYATASTVLALTGDDEVAQIGLPFPFNFYGQVTSTAWVDTNGILFFRPAASFHADCPSVPDPAAPNGGAYVFCDDLLIDTSAAIRTQVAGTAPNRTFTIEWHNALRYDDPQQTDRISATITLSETGTITFNYAGIGTDAEEQGSLAVVGVEDKAGTAGVSHSDHQSVLANNNAIVFTPVTSGATSTGGAGVAGAFTFTASGVTDVASYQYGLNVNPPTTVVNAASLGGNGTATVTPTADGPQVLYVRSQDRAANRSGIYAYHFFAGPGGLTSPKPGDITAAFLPLTAVGHPASTGVTYQWRRAETDTWTDIPLTFVSHAVGGGPVGAWPVTTTGSGKYPKLNWNVEATLAAADAQSVPRDGPLQVRALFSGLNNGTANPVKFTFDRNLAAAASAQVGPGSVNLITGNYTVGGSDAAASGIGVGRTFNTRRPGGTDPMFGPGWTSGVVVGEAKAPYTKLTVYGSLVQITLPGGDVLGFTKKTTTGSGATFDPPPGSEDLILVYTTASNAYTLTNGDGDVVTFTRNTADPAGQYAPSAATPPGAGNSTSLSWEKVTVDSVDVVRPTRVLAPVPAGVSCTPSLVRGCRAISFTYATATTATGTGEAQWSDYFGRIKEVSFTAWDPDLPTPAMRTVVLARYAYDNTGRLRAAWDPRFDYLDASATKHLWERYGYDGDGVLTTITPAGQEPWQLTYTTIPGDAGKGRLAQVTRSALAAGTATQTVYYKIPISGTGAPRDMSAAQTARWGQTEPPVSATALYPPDQIPTGDQATGQLPSSYEWATLTYLDANARQVNTAEPGGDYLSTTGYDLHGNTVLSLTPSNRRRALDASATDNPAQEAAIAGELSTVTVYSADGQQLDYTLGPIHDVRLADGTLVRGRGLVDHTYDQGAPGTGGPFNLITTTVQGLRYRNAAGAQVDADLRKTTTEYDWTLQQPTATIVDPDGGGLALATRTGYNTAGDVVSTTTPAGGTSTSTPATRLIVYYTTAANATYPECGGHAEWARMVCRTGPGGQPGTGPELPATVNTYDMYGQAGSAVEKISTGVLRTTTINYDAAGRSYEAAVTAAAGLGSAVPKTRNVYDPATGQNTATQSIDGGGAVTASIGRSYDTLGRITTYTDANGNTTTTTYDKNSRHATVNDGKATRTYTYDGGTERRGLPTHLVDTQGGSFTGSYDVDGNINSEDRPGGIRVTWIYDEAGGGTALRYEKLGCPLTDCTLYTEITTASPHDQWRNRNSTLSSQTNSYDRAGRLTAVADTVGGACTTRSYGYSAATNRTSLSTYGPASNGACQTTTGTTTTWTYDTADRLITSGTNYDVLGRTTVAAAATTANSSGGDVTITYHANDIVKTISQGGRSASYNADVLSTRIRSWSDNPASSAITKVNHYGADVDSPTWTTEDDQGNYSRILFGLSGFAGTKNTLVGPHLWSLANLHGDLIATIIDGDQAISATHEHTENGLPRQPGDTGTRRYGWLGTAQRAADSPSGMILMGARLYNPATSRFLQTDPVYGGAANPYAYCWGDAVGCSDIQGTYGCWRQKTRWTWWNRKLDIDFMCQFSDFAIFMIKVLGIALGAIIAIVGILFSATGWGVAFAIAGIIIAAFSAIIGEFYDRYCWRKQGAWLTGHTVSIYSGRGSARLAVGWFGWVNKRGCL